MIELPDIRNDQNSMPRQRAVCIAKRLRQIPKERTRSHRKRARNLLHGDDFLDVLDILGEQLQFFEQVLLFLSEALAEVLK